MRFPAALALFNAGSFWSALFGIAFIFRCDVIGPPPPGGWPTCWATGGVLAGVPAAKRLLEKGAYTQGYWTLNPALRQKRKDEEET